VKRTLMVLGAALLLAVMVVAMAMPAFAKLQTTQTNGGGNTPNGNANGVPTTTVTSGNGNAPPGQNK
jgi:hypothetical protein